MNLSHVDNQTLEVAYSIRGLAQGLSISQFNTAISIAEEMVSMGSTLSLLPLHDSSVQD
mgnify:CR=1 FL=1